ncbi:BMC domain-containing protein [Vibrio astriarenae]|uniref:BMC domain-containing protein n=1 Tax=Vibrio astriarenae TaxID=1481923 RepID=A0A7Z2T6T2_9VIBR|nr:BMC domain-containing protein [Vibrio astriarenae]QIA65439.1 BMC domain-containing protein [Vibrio astriarenae]
MKNSFGMVEVAGLALAVTVADVMAKSANIEILGLERTNGSGWILIKISGDVGSVTAAVESGAALAQQQQGLVSHKVIARPADGLSSLWNPLKVYEALTAPESTKKPNRSTAKPKTSAAQNSTSAKPQASKPTATTKSRPKRATSSSSASVAAVEDKEGSKA